MHLDNLFIDVYNLGNDTDISDLYSQIDEIFLFKDEWKIPNGFPPSIRSISKWWTVKPSAEF